MTVSARRRRRWAGRRRRWALQPFDTSARVRPTAGWSSIPFGATPVCPCTWSKKPTPEMVALPERLVKDDVAEPHAPTSRFRALRILALASHDAPHVQDALGNSTIIVSRRSRGSAITRWMSLSSSSFIATRAARTRNVLVSKPAACQAADACRRLPTAQAPDRGRPRREVDLAGQGIGQRLDVPALDTARDLPRVGRRRLRRENARPGKWGDHQPKESDCHGLATSTFPQNLNDCPLWTAMSSVLAWGR